MEYYISRNIYIAFTVFDFLFQKHWKLGVWDVESISQHF